MLVCTFYGRDEEGHIHTVSVETYGRLTPELATCHSCEQLLKVRWGARALVEEHLEQVHTVPRPGGRPYAPLALRRFSGTWLTLSVVVVTLLVAMLIVALVGGANAGR